jgi:hypothetical protein
MGSTGAAHADNQSFIEGLLTMGLLNPNANSSALSAAVGVGQDICEEFYEGKTAVGIMADMERSVSPKEASGWIVVAVRELCPQYMNELQ